MVAHDVDPPMARAELTIDGAAVPTAASFDVVDPATGRVFAQAPAASPEDVGRAMAAAQRAFLSWRCDDVARRVALRAGANAVLGSVDEMAALITAEQGKPYPDARTEVRAAGAWLHYYADVNVPPEVVSDRRAVAEIAHRPLGVVAAITPWNYPIALAAWKIAPALRAGNTVVLKPSPYTPLATLVLGAVLREVLPAGVLNVLSGPDPLGEWLTGHPVPRMISFTGSVAAGRRVALSAAVRLTRMTLELGGNDPAVVLDDVDPATIADSLFWGAFANNGQMCMAVKRVYVARRRFDDVVSALAERARTVRVGNGNDPGVRLGPVTTAVQFHRVDDLVHDARACGGVVVVGGAPLDRPGYFFAPTILVGVDDGTRVVDEEQFGPVLPVIAYDDEDDAVARANRTEYGLTASVWSADPDRAARLAARLDVGQVSVNAHGGGVRPDLPFGGHKSSGIGVENGLWGLYAGTDTHVVVRPGAASTA